MGEGLATWTLHLGSALDVLRGLPDASVSCCVTSPPYFGLRDYGHAEQIGLEGSPDAFVSALVSVFSEARRVLADDGVAFVNIGDSYVSSGGNTVAHGPGAQCGNTKAGVTPRVGGPRSAIVGMKTKDLIGVPWMLAFALRNPHYSGTIQRLEDRVWLAAMLDAEGCLFIHKRKAGQSNGQGYVRQSDTYSPGVEICNTSLAVIERIAALVGKGSICTSEKGRHGRKQTLYRWNLRTTESRDFVREIYPHLIAKRQQARILCGCLSYGVKAEAAHAALIGLHNGIESDVDFAEPESMLTPGWYLRSDVIWAKSNPMPESVQDRPTKAHEYVFLLTKSPRYYWNADAIREAYAPSTLKEFEQGYDGNGQKDYDAAGVQNPSSVKSRIVAKARSVRATVDTKGGNQGNGVMTFGGAAGANARTVWTIATQPSPFEHFAVMPKALARKCIVAGCPPGGTVLDPFAGMATTGVVALEEGRSFVGIELNSTYHATARQRLAGVAPLLAVEVSA